MAGKPKWVTPERQAKLVNLFVRSQGFCVYGLSPCKGKWHFQEIALCRWESAEKVFSLLSFRLF